MKSISLLLGAGFSAPQGYPVGCDLNNSILACTGDDFAFSTDGRITVTIDGGKPDFGYKTSYDSEFEFCRDLMQFFLIQKGYFDYEEFYDFFTNDAKDDPKVEAFFKTKKYGTEKNLNQLLYAIKNIYTQLVAHYLKDKDGKKWYVDEEYLEGPSYKGYTGILNSLKYFGEERILNIHTLNHDLFFERLSNSIWFDEALSDGFDETESPYYGYYKIEGSGSKIRLPQFINNYSGRYRLFKLHGSRDYGIFSSPKGMLLVPEKYIKTKYGVGFSDFHKEIIGDNGIIKDERCWINYHADFLTGTTSKIDRYTEPLLFDILFTHFKKNLEHAEKLVIIGYGCKDSEINRILLKHFDFKSKPSYIIDPFAGEDVKILQNQLRAKLIEKQLEDILIKDII